MPRRRKVAKKERTPKEQAEFAAAQYNKKNKGKIFKMVKVSDHPVTYKEVEVT